MKIVFLDTNKLYGAYRHWLQYKKLHKSSLLLFKNNSKIDIYVSSYVVEEIKNLKKLELNHELADIYAFFDYLWVYILQSISPTQDIYSYVHDPLDAQLLQDAVDIQADYLITNNTRDFKIDMIKKDFNCIVTDHIPREVYT